MKYVPRDEPLYWAAWNELFKIKVEHFKASSSEHTDDAGQAWVRQACGQGSGS